VGYQVSKWIVVWWVNQEFEGRWGKDKEGGQRSRKSEGQVHMIDKRKEVRDMEHPDVGNRCPIV
jgi:hypothetical protein